MSRSERYPRSSIQKYLRNEASARCASAAYDAVLYYKHWGTGMTNELELALLDYADELVP